MKKGYSRQNLPINDIEVRFGQEKDAGALYKKIMSIDDEKNIRMEQ